MTGLVDRRLPVKEQDRAVDQRLPAHVRDVIHQVARGEVVRAIDDVLVVLVLEDPLGVVGGERLVVGDDLHVGIRPLQAVEGRIDLQASDVRRLVQELPLQVREIDDVEVDDADRSHPGQRHVDRDRRAQAARADHEHSRVPQLSLPGRPDGLHDDVTRVPHDLVRGQRGRVCPVRGWRYSTARERGDHRQLIAIRDHGVHTL